MKAQEKDDELSVSIENNGVFFSMVYLSKLCTKLIYVNFPRNLQSDFIYEKYGRDCPDTADFRLSRIYIYLEGILGIQKWVHFKRDLWAMR
jgi:hypothetical protein